MVVRPVKTQISLGIRVFAVRMKKAWVLSYPLRAQRRLRSDRADAQADLILRCPHSHFVSFVMSWLILFFASGHKKHKRGYLVVLFDNLTFLITLTSTQPIICAPAFLSHFRSTSSLNVKDITRAVTGQRSFPELRIAKKTKELLC